MDRTWAIGDLLPAAGPHAAHAKALATFGQFVGSWDLDVRFFDAAGEPTPARPARWSFDWVLDGRAVQDVLVMPGPVDGSLVPGDRGIGTTLRYLDPTAGLWRLVFVGATSGNFVNLTGGAAGPDIVLRGVDMDGSSLRWTFTEITPSSFHWLGHTSNDGGDSWRLEQEMHARRSVPTGGSDDA